MSELRDSELKSSELETQKQSLFIKWAESELSAKEQQQFEIWCKEDDAFADKVAVHGRLQFMAENYQPQEVPNWQPETVFQQEKSFNLGQRQPWWQWRGLPAMSFAMSCFAIMLVVFKLEVTVNEGSMIISFAGAGEQQRMERLVNDKLLEYAKLQETQFTEKSKQLQEQQMQMNNQLANYLLSTSRTERREDFAQLIEHVNEQRADDQVFYVRQINQLKDQFEFDSDIPQ